MKAPEFSKVFNKSDARAGAPYGLANGDRAKIYEWDARGVANLIGVHSEAHVDSPAMWMLDGRPHQGMGGESTLVMLPLGLIDGKPVFVGDKFLWPTGVLTTAAPDMSGGSWGRCAWPAPPRAYPLTLMTPDECYAAYCSDKQGTVVGGTVLVANAALRHAIDAGQLIEPGDRPARDMAVAEAVRKAVFAEVKTLHADSRAWSLVSDWIGNLLLAEIIAGVAP